MTPARIGYLKKGKHPFGNARGRRPFRQATSRTRCRERVGPGILKSNERVSPKSLKLLPMKSGPSHPPGSLRLNLHPVNPACRAVAPSAEHRRACRAVAAERRRVRPVKIPFAVCAICDKKSVSNGSEPATIVDTHWLRSAVGLQFACFSIGLWAYCRERFWDAPSWTRL